MAPQTYDYAVIGAGIVGIALAREIAITAPHARVVVFDKESDLGAHASGRNSGVLHAGFYYAPDSLKAQLTRSGNALLREFLSSTDVQVRQTGKVVVATNEHQLGPLDELARRAQANGVHVEIVDEVQLREIEPLARTVARALWSPTTSVADPLAVLKAIADDTRKLGVEIRMGEHVIHASKRAVTAKHGEFTVGHVVNAAGLYADRVAEWFGVLGDYVMLPFKGLYWYSNKQIPLQRHVYPVPDARNPFLGVHTTVTADGRVKIGPTAIPGLWRESYGGLSGFAADELFETIVGLPKLLTSPNHNMLATVRNELPKYSRRYMVKQARLLVPTLDESDFTIRGKVGVRAQLFDTKRRQLEMDFVIRGDEHSTHMLNSVSPAWTSSLAVARYTVEDMHRRNAI